MKRPKKDMVVKSTTTLSRNQDGNLPQLLAQGAAQDSTLIDNEFWTNDGEKKILALLAMYKSLLDNTWSPDARALSAMGAIKMLSACMPKKEAERLVCEVMTKVKRTRSMLDDLF